MPKLKTHSGAKKRFKKTASGKIKRKSTMDRHLMLGKSNGRKRRLAQNAYISETHEKRISRLIPYA